MGVKRKGNNPSSRMPTLPTKASDGKPAAPANKSQDAGIQTNLSQMVRSMSGTRYSNGQVKKEKEEQFQKLSDGRTTDESSMIQQQQGGSAPKANPMQALFLAAGQTNIAVQSEIMEKVNRKENLEVVLDDKEELQQLSEDSEENRLAKAIESGQGGKPKKADVAELASMKATLGIKSQGEVQEAKKGQNVEMHEEVNQVIHEEKTFGFVPAGSTLLPTPGGHEIQLLSKDKLTITQHDGEQDEIELKGDYVVITDRFGEEHSHKVPTSLILDDGTKLTFGKDSKIGITNRSLFAEVSNGGVQRNNRSTLAGGIKEELIDMGLSEAEAMKKLEEVGAQLKTLAPDDINLDDLAGFNAADLDYLFRDGDYLVRDYDGTWTANPIEPTEAALDAMTEGRLEDTVWRMGAFCQEAEDILFDFMDVILLDNNRTTVMDLQ